MAGELGVNLNALLCNAPDGVMTTAITHTSKQHRLMKKSDRYFFRQSAVPLMPY